MKNIKVFALAAHGKGLSGSDRIFIEFARRWQKVAVVKIYVNEEGREMCRRQNLSEGTSLKYIVWDTSKWKKLGFVVTYFCRIIHAIFESFKILVNNNSDTVLYSASEFWMDSLPAFILKLQYPKAIWAAAWYQTAPNPLKGYAEGNRDEKYTFKALLYWLAQLPVKPIVGNFADHILINNEDERKQFPNANQKNKLEVVIGAIDLLRINKWIKSHIHFIKIYDAVFQGRFHPQKGVVELIDIWRKVVDKRSDAKLAMIGDGPLMENVKLKIKNLKLENNVRLLGYVFDGDEKYKIFSQSKIVVHPAFYDSGGMASAEAMAFGLPCVGFDLSSYKSYYPKGMVKVETGNINKFSNVILELLNNKGKSDKIAREALEMLNKNWSWDTRANEVLNSISN